MYRSQCVCFSVVMYMLEFRVWQLAQIGCAVFKAVLYDSQFRKQQKL